MNIIIPVYRLYYLIFFYCRPELEFSKLISNSTGACNNSCSNNSNNVSISPLSAIHPPCLNGHEMVSVNECLGCEWRITNINKDFKTCPTYGSVLIVPKQISDEQITQSALFRDGGRFPVLSYRHENGVSFINSN